MEVSEGREALRNAGLAIIAVGVVLSGLVYGRTFLVPLANWLQHSTGSWHAVFVVATIANLAVAACALFVVKPLRARQTAATVAPQAQVRAAE